MKNKTYIVTGAAGHLGRHITQELIMLGASVRAFVLPEEEMPATKGSGNLTIFRGDVRDAETLAPLFTKPEEGELVVIHAAAVVDINTKIQPLTWSVNVNGVANMIKLSLAHKVTRFVYVSSVHAIPEPPGHQPIRETDTFSPDLVVGGYAKTKAEATRMVLEAARNSGLPAVVLHPSGIIGPGDPGRNNLVNAFRAYLAGKLPLCPRGGSDAIDVRDVAGACIAAIDKGRVGQTYILSAYHFKMFDAFGMLDKITGQKHHCMSVPVWPLKLVAPFIEWSALRSGKKPLITPYSLYTVKSDDSFCIDKARRELGFNPRPLEDSLRDTVAEFTQVNPK